MTTEQANYRNISILNLLQASGHEAAEDMLVCSGWASDHAQAKRLIQKVQSSRLQRTQP